MKKDNTQVVKKLKDKNCLYKNFVRGRILNGCLIGTTLLGENSRKILNYESIDGFRLSRIFYLDPRS